MSSHRNRPPKADEQKKGVSRRGFLAGSATASATALSGVAADVRRAAAQEAAPAGGGFVRTSITINGTGHALALDPRTTLLDLLREDLDLTGTKVGCNHGQCGACTVLVDGKRVNSCLCLTAQQEGTDVTTIEGIGTPEKLSALQKAFVEMDGYQCGYCTPGQIMSATAMLEELSRGDPSYVSESLDAPKLRDDGEMAERMSGNLCRCSAYPLIREAIAMAAEVKS